MRLYLKDRNKKVCTYTPTFVSRKTMGIFSYIIIVVPLTILTVMPWFYANLSGHTKISRMLDKCLFLDEIRRRG